MALMKEKIPRHVGTVTALVTSGKIAQSKKKEIEIDLDGQEMMGGSGTMRCLGLSLITKIG